MANGGYQNSGSNHGEGDSKLKNECGENFSHKDDTVWAIKNSVCLGVDWASLCVSCIGVGRAGVVVYGILVHLNVEITLLGRSARASSPAGAEGLVKEEDTSDGSGSANETEHNAGNPLTNSNVGRRSLEVDDIFGGVNVSPVPTRNRELVRLRNKKEISVKYYLQ